MAVELCSENSVLVMSPRISFSHDLSQSDVVPVEQHPFRSNSSSGGAIDFDFCIRGSYDQESSSADELFSDGKILPTQIKQKTVKPKEIHKPDPQQQIQEIDNESSKETKMESSGTGEKQSTKSFWGFKRSSSLNCGSGYGRSLCPLPLLSRSNSTGSSASAKKQNSQKISSSAASKVSSSSSSQYQKPPLKKSYGSYGNGVRVNPVLNVPSVNLFGLGSILFNGKDKNKRK